jgi:hypothetical protein
MKDKKGEGTPIWLLIATILGIIVLVVVALGFVGGWDNLLERFNIFSSSSLTTVSQACGVQCSLGEMGKIGYCNEIRSINNLEDGQLENICKEIVENDTACSGADIREISGDEDYSDEKVNFDKKQVRVTCNTLEEIGLIECEDINCGERKTKTSVNTNGQ